MTCLPSHLFLVLASLSDYIIPADDRSPSGTKAGVHVWIDYLCSEDLELAMQIQRGLNWVDQFAFARFGVNFLDAFPEQQRTVVHLIAYREHAVNDPWLGPGIEFFATLRALCLSGYFTSEIGFSDLQYEGNARLSAPPSCPI